MFGIDVTDYDKKVWAEELCDFLPDKIIVKTNKIIPNKIPGRYLYFSKSNGTPNSLSYEH